MGSDEDQNGKNGRSQVEFTDAQPAKRQAEAIASQGNELPERRIAEVNVGVEEMQAEKQDQDVFPRKHYGKREDAGYFPCVRRAFRGRNDPEFDEKQRQKHPKQGCDDWREEKSNRP